MQMQSNANLRPAYIQRLLDGCYMGTGKIENDRIPRCHKCGGPWSEQEQFGYKIHYCEKCKAYPQKLRVRKYIPSSKEDAGHRKDITHYKFKRITDPLQALACIREIDERLANGTFDPKEYESREYAKNFTLSYFIEKTYLPRKRDEAEMGRLSDQMLRKKQSYAANYIIPFFKDEDIRQITGAMVTNFYFSMKHLKRQKDLVTGELRVVLNMAIDEGIIDKLPKFPELEQSERRDPEETRLLTIQEQDEVIAKIDNPIYSLAIRMLTIYPIRPCDVRALRWRDVIRDDDEPYIVVGQHFSGAKMEKGRKSSRKRRDKRAFTIPITAEMEEILNQLPPGIGEAPLFPSPRGRFCSENNLQRAWRKAIKLTRVPYVELYVATKTSIMTDLGGMCSQEDLALVAGIDANTTDKYNLQRDRALRQRQRMILERRRGR